MRRFRRTDDIRARRVKTANTFLTAANERELRGEAPWVDGVLPDERSELGKVTRWGGTTSGRRAYLPCRAHLREPSLAPYRWCPGGALLGP